MPDRTRVVLRTVTLTGAHRHRLVLLTHDTADGSMVVTGVAALFVSRGAEFMYPARLAAQLSRLLADDEPNPST